MQKNIYFSSDHHFGHEGVIKWCNRPFNDVDHMDRVMINNWNSTVMPNDIVYYLGDISMGKGDYVKNIISQLNGYKILIIGNHDKKSHTFYLQVGFKAIFNSATIQVAKHIVTLSHCPLIGVWREDTSHIKNSIDENWHKESVFSRFSCINNGQVHLHGHVHSRPEDRILGQQFDVGVDANNYTPVSMKTINQFVQSYYASKR